MVATPEPAGQSDRHALDHGVSFVMGDNFAQLEGLKSSCRAGLLRTGMGVCPAIGFGTPFPTIGPYVTDCFAVEFRHRDQMGFTLARKPEMQAAFSVSSSKSDDLHSLLATVQAMPRGGPALSLERASPCAALCAPANLPVACAGPGSCFTPRRRHAAEWTS